MVNPPLRPANYVEEVAIAAERLRGSSMIVSIMQPYLFPYLGYFQLIDASDLFVIYDDVQYSKGGWINRNRVLLAGAPAWFTLPVERTAVETPINAKRYQLDARAAGKVTGLFEAAYRRAPAGARARAMLDSALAHDDLNVARFNENAIRLACAELGIATRMVRSSQLDRDRSLGGQSAVIDICRRLDATCYLNAIGGVELYDPASFEADGIELRFIRSAPEPYDQRVAEYVPNLSILDLLANCDQPAAQARLAQRRLLSRGQARQAEQI